MIVSKSLTGVVSKVRGQVAPLNRRAAKPGFTAEKKLGRIRLQGDSVEIAGKKKALPKQSSTGPDPDPKPFDICEGWIFIV